MMSESTWAIFGKLVAGLAAGVGVVAGAVNIYSFVDSRKENHPFKVDGKLHSSREGWFDTGLRMSLNKKYSLTAFPQDTVLINKGAPIEISVDADGDKSRTYDCECKPFLCGQLVARIGPTGKVIPIGKQHEFENAEGHLYLAVFDSNGDNNEGYFRGNILVSR